jgi:hypothetical protein
MNDANRRNFLRNGVGVALAAASLRPFPSSANEGPALAFSNRAHIFASAKVKDRLIWCFCEILGCGTPASLNAPGLLQPILAFRFPGGGSLSVEFTDDALDEQAARRGAWLEIWSADPSALRQKILDAGLSQVKYGPTTTFYFAAPGGQVLGVVSGRNPSAGELRTKQ